MGEFVLCLLTVSFIAGMAFYLGVRRERGRQMRFEEATRIKKQARRGTKLRSIKLRR